MIRTRQTGFSLIELMIVVVIIGILAAIAIPQYQNYVARSQMAEAIGLASGAKSAIQQFADSNQLAGIPLEQLISGPTTNPGKYVSSITYVNNTPPTATQVSLLITFNSGSPVATALRGLALEIDITPGNGGVAATFVCNHSGATTVPVQYIPSSC